MVSHLVSEIIRAPVQRVHWEEEGALWFPGIITHRCYWSRVTRHHLSVCRHCSDTQSERVSSDRLSSAPQGPEEESVPPLRVFSETVAASTF